MVFLTFATARLDYQGPVFHAVFDVTLSYKAYVEQKEESDDEERIFTQISYEGHQVKLTLTEILRHESDPADATFVARLGRLISNTVLAVTLDLWPRVYIAPLLQFDYVDFVDGNMDGVDNISYRAGMALGYHMPEGYDIAVDGGYLEIQYLDTTGPPNAQGYFVRGSVSREATQRLTFSAAVGFTEIESDGGLDDETIDALVGVQYDVTPTMAVRAGYSRRFGFSNGVSFQTSDQVTASIHYDVNENWRMRGIAAYSHVNPIRASDRDFYSITAETEYRVAKFLFVSTGVTYRTGDAFISGTFHDTIWRLGLTGTW